MSVEAFEEDLTMPTALVLGDGVELTHVWMATDRVELVPCNAPEPVANDTTGVPDTEIEDPADAPESEDAPAGASVTATDLLSGASLPGSLLVRGTGRSFCGFDVSIRPLEESEVPLGAPVELTGHSMLVRGVRKDGNPFVVRASLARTIRLNGAIELSADSPNELVLGFAVNGWVTQGGLAGLDGDPILIDEETNSALYESFEDTVLSSGRLFRNYLGGSLIAR